MLVRVLVPPLVLNPGHLCWVLVPGSWFLGPACVPGTGPGPGPGPEAGPRAGLGPKFWCWVLGSGFWVLGLGRWVLGSVPCVLGPG